MRLALRPRKRPVLSEQPGLQLNRTKVYEARRPKCAAP